MSVETASLESMCELVVDCPHSTPKWTDSGVVVLRNQNIRNGELDLSSPSYTDEKGYRARIKRAVPQAGDIVFTREAPMGEVCVIPEGITCCLGQRQVLLRPRTSVHGEYLYWALQSPFVKHQISWNEGTGTTVSNVRIPVLKALQIPRRGREEPVIASVLNSLVKRIRLNHQINQTLEQMAQAIFKSWFVDFEPVKAKIAALETGGSQEDALLAAMQAICGKGEAELTRLHAEQPEQYAELRATAELFPSAMQDSELGEIPAGWSVTSVNEIAEIVKGKSYKSAELEPSKTALVTLKSFNRGGGYRLDGLKEYTGKYKPQQVVMAGDLIIAYTDVTQAADVIGKPAMVIGDERYEQLVISLDVAVIRPVDSALKPYLYGLAKTDTFQFHTKAHTTGTTVLHLAKNAVPEFRLALPSKDLVDAYSDHANPLFTLINEKVQESRALESLRDTLLPRLLSGELSASNSGNLPISEPLSAMQEVQ
ncbi:restriction endonuclease subunit S [Thalassospira tepidiphila]|uniref:restriction endonuclease subunit S n=1 Tax=Pseudomonadota TaxID=1224 RepID=UPI003AA7D807